MFDCQDTYKACLANKLNRIRFDWNWKRYLTWADFEHYIFLLLIFFLVGWFSVLCNFLCSSSSRFSANHVWDLGMVNRYSWFWKSFNMLDRCSEFSFFQDIYVRTDIRIDISIAIRPITTQLAFTCLNSTMETPENVWNLLKVINKRLLFAYFTYCSNLAGRYI